MFPLPTELLKLFIPGHRQKSTPREEASSSNTMLYDDRVFRCRTRAPSPEPQVRKKLKKDKALMNSFQDGLSYSVFKTITDQFLKGVDTRGESEVKAQGFKVALAIDATAKLTAIDNHPMNKVLGFGTKYLKENFSSWIQQHGGWEKVLGVSQEEVD